MFNALKEMKRMMDGSRVTISSRQHRPKAPNPEASRMIHSLLTANEAAIALNLSVHTIRQWIWQRRLPVIKLGRAVRLRREDLDAFIERHRRDDLSW
jgi:excisionase family DNA binding protein